VPIVACLLGAIVRDCASKCREFKLYQLDLREEKPIYVSALQSAPYCNAMAPNLRLNAIAFISPQNHPIHIEVFAKKEDNALKYHYIAHTSLDVVEERGVHFSCQLRDWHL
jgi:hypothetical protein